MKKSIKFFAAALAIVAAASCTKEVFDDAKAPVATGDGFTFTASIGTESASTKLAVAADGKCTWTAGDIIIVYNGNNSEDVIYDKSGAFVSDNIQTITLTDEMISADKKTVTISTTLDAPAAGKWYFYAVSRVTNIYKIRSNGNAISGAVSETSQSAVPFTASASCSSDAATIQFKHALAYLKISASAWLYKVVVRSNNSDSIQQPLDIYPSDGHTVERTTDPLKANEYVANVNSVAVNSPFYVAISPFTWSEGISVDVYYGSDFSADWAAKTPTKTVTSSKSFTAVAGHVYDMGNILVDRTPYPTYYERWEAGQSINIGGVNYNKADSGLKAMHITANTALTDGSADYWGKILFVDEGVTVTCGTMTSFRMNNTVIVGNKIGTRSTIEINQKFWISAEGKSRTTDMFKNMNILPKFTNDNLCWNRSGVQRLVIDDCYLDFVTNMGFSGTWNSNDYGEVAVIGSDIRCTLDNKQLFYYSGTSKLTVKNNVFFAPAGENHMISSLFQFGDRTADHSDIGVIDVDIENNTFINLRGNGNAMTFLCQNYTNAVVNNNLLIYTEGTGLPNNLFLLGNSNKTTLGRPTVVCADNYIYDVATETANSFIAHWSFSTDNTGGDQSRWNSRNTATYGLASNPYTTMDLTNGVFANTTDYGAKR